MTDRVDDLKMLCYAFELIGDVCARNQIEPPAVNFAFKDNRQVYRFECAIKASKSYIELFGYQPKPDSGTLYGIKLTVSDPDRRPHKLFT